MNIKKLISIIILVIILVIVIIQNRAPVQAHILFISIQMPLILLLIITTAIGFVIGVLVSMINKSKSKETN